jgi:hypothetical protein
MVVGVGVGVVVVVMVVVVVVVMIYTDPSELFKIFPIVTHLNAKLQNLYLAKQNIVIDEFLTL